MALAKPSSKQQQQASNKQASISISMVMCNSTMTMESAPQARRLAQIALLAIGCVLSLFLLLDDGYEYEQPWASDPDPPPDYLPQIRRLAELAEGEAPSTTAGEHQGREDAWYKDIDYDPEFPCGRRKCFFPRQSDPSRGYLVGGRSGSSWRGTRRGFQEYYRSRLKQVHEFAAELEREHGVQHFYDSDPFVEPFVPPYFAARIDPRLRGRFPPGAILEVQPVRTAPPSATVFKCWNEEDGKVGPLVSRSNSARPGSEDRRADERDSPGYREALRVGLERTIDLVGAVPALTFDFQVMLDEEGMVYQLDLDRAFRIFQSNPFWQRATTIRVVPDEMVRGVLTCLEDAADGLKTSIEEG